MLRWIPGSLAKTVPHYQQSINSSTFISGKAQQDFWIQLGRLVTRSIDTHASACYQKRCDTSEQIRHGTHLNSSEMNILNPWMTKSELTNLHQLCSNSAKFVNTGSTVMSYSHIRFESLVGLVELHRYFDLQKRYPSYPGGVQDRKHRQSATRTPQRLSWTRAHTNIIGSRPT